MSGTNEKGRLSPSPRGWDREVALPLPVCMQQSYTAVSCQMLQRYAHEGGGVTCPKYNDLLNHRSVL